MEKERMEDKRTKTKPDPDTDFGLRYTKLNDGLLLQMQRPVNCKGHIEGTHTSSYCKSESDSPFMTHVTLCWKGLGEKVGGGL